MYWTSTNELLSKKFEDGTLPSLVYVTRNVYEAAEAPRPIHSHSTVCEMILITDGSGGYTLGDQKYLVKKGDLILYNQGQLHELRPDEESGMESYCLGISNLRKTGLALNCLTADDGSFVRDTDMYFDEMRRTVEYMYDSYDRGTDENLIAQISTVMLVLMADNLDSYAAYSRRYPTKESLAVRQIRDYINRNFAADLSVTDIAHAVGCSETYVSHTFKKETGNTPGQYIIQRRIGQAQTLLISTELTVREISRRVGYANSNYFINLFRKNIHRSPNQYREEYRAKARGMAGQM